MRGRRVGAWERIIKCAKGYKSGRGLYGTAEVNGAGPFSHGGGVSVGRPLSTVTEVGRYAQSKSSQPDGQLSQHL